MEQDKEQLFDCYQFPDKYTLCSSNVCVPTDIPCPCREDEFQCPGNNKCIPKTAICDGKYDCLNKRDEIKCGTCREDEFQCPGNNKCIPKTAICDGKYDCLNKRDEIKCGTDRENGDLSVSIVITVSAISIVLCVVSVVLLLLYIKRRHGRQTESVEEPLQRGNSIDSENRDDEENSNDNMINNNNLSIQHTSDLNYTKHHKMPDYMLVSKTDNFGDFGEGLLCASTPKQGVRHVKHASRKISGNISDHSSLIHMDLPDILINSSVVGMSKVEYKLSRNNDMCKQSILYKDSSKPSYLHNDLHSIPYIDRSSENIDR